MSSYIKFGASLGAAVARVPQADFGATHGNLAEVCVIMGSSSDREVMSKATDVLRLLEVECLEGVVSAHRTPEKMFEFAKGAAARGVKVIIAGAGGAAHLPGMVAALTTLPVIGVPVNVGGLAGIDSLLSIVQMPRGVPVATVAINGAENAGVLAASIIALSNDTIQKNLRQYRQKL